MASANHDEANCTLDPEIVQEMQEFGITRVQVDHFHYKEYRYTNLKDAVAQAKRDQRTVGSDRFP